MAAYVIFYWCIRFGLIDGNLTAYGTIHIACKPVFR